MSVRHTPNRAGLAAMESAPWMVAGLARKCEPIRQRAIANTPVLSGRMAASWRLFAGIRDRRALVQIYNTAMSPLGFHYPLIVEHGNSRSPRQRPLGRALDAFRTGT